MIPVKMILFMIPATLVLLVAKYYVGKKIITPLEDSF